MGSTVEMVKLLTACSYVHQHHHGRNGEAADGMIVHQHHHHAGDDIDHLLSCQQWKDLGKGRFLADTRSSARLQDVRQGSSTASISRCRKRL